MKDLTTWLLGVHEKIVGWMGYIAPLLSRIMLGYSMWIDGRGKRLHLEGVGKFFATLHVPFSTMPLPHPEMQAWFIANLQYFGGILILVGFLTRPVSLLLAGAMAGALLMSDSGELIKKWTEGSPTDATSTMLLVLAVWTLCTGAGPISVDGILRFFIDWWRGVIDRAGLRARLPEIVAGWVFRLYIGLVILALVPVSDGAADRLVSWGLRSVWVRAPFDGEFDDPPASVTVYPPNYLGLVLWALGIAAVGALILYLTRDRRTFTAGRSTLPGTVPSD